MNQSHLGAAPVSRRPYRASITTAPLLISAGLLVLTLALMLGANLFVQTGYALHVGDRGDERVLVRFHGVEDNGSETYRWSEPLFGVYLWGFEGRPAIVDIRLTAPRPDGSPPTLLSLSSAGVDLGSFTVEPGWRHYHILAPTNASGETALSLETPEYIPASDPRPLGVVLSDVRVIDVSGRQLLPPPIRSLFLLSLPLLGWLLAWRLKVRRPVAISIGILLAIVAAWATARPVASGYFLPTLYWPWFPALPLALLVFTPQLGRLITTARQAIIGYPAIGWIGLGLALAALLAIRLGLPMPLGLAGLIVGGWAGLQLIDHSSESAEQAEDQKIGSTMTRIALVATVLVAIFLRFYNLDGQPAGLWRDESRHGLQALQIWNDPSYRPVYVVEGADLPALLFYLMAPVVGLLGPHVWSVRLVSALVGALTPLALYWAARPLIGRRAALIGAALIAWASWSLSMSRWAFPATLDHLLTLTAIGLAWRGLGSSDRETGDRRQGTRDREAAAGRWRSTRSIMQLGLAGLFAGLATYAYHTGRVAPLALAAIVLLRLGFSWPAWKRALPGLIAAAVVGLLVMAPLLSFIGRDLGGYNRRVSQVSVLTSNYLDIHSPIGLILDNTGRYLQMWHVQGEPNGRHHLPNAPMLDPLVGLLLVVGVGMVLRGGAAARRRWALLIIPAVYLVPAVFSTDAPHAMRALGSLAPTCMLAGLALNGLVSISRWPDGRRPSAQRRNGKSFFARGFLSRSPIFVLAVLLASLAFNSWIYFGVMRVDPAVYDEFDVLETTMGRIAQAPAESSDPELRNVTVYLPAKLRGTDTIRFLTSSARSMPYDERPLPAEGVALLIIPGDATPAAQAEALASLGPQATPLASLPTYPGSDRPIIFAYARGEAAARVFAVATDRK